MKRDNKCLGDELAEYADGRLAADRTNHWDFHLITCAHCRHAVAAERRLQDALRLSTPAVPTELRNALLALAITGVEDVATAERGPFAVPHVPVAPVAVTRHVASTPLAVVSPSAPALHRSPLRSAVFAAVAASASAAAAIGLSAAGAGAPASIATNQQRPLGTARVASVQVHPVNYVWRLSMPGDPAAKAQSTP